MNKILIIAALLATVSAFSCSDSSAPVAEPAKMEATVEPGTETDTTEPGGEKALDILIKQLKSEQDEKKRCEYVEQLDKIGTEKALAAIRTALNDESPNVRMAAVAAVWDKEDKQAVKALIELLNDEEQTVRMYVVDVLQELTEQEFGEDYDKWKAWYDKNKEK